jgi:hypothetical protein
MLGRLDETRWPRDRSALFFSVMTASVFNRSRVKRASRSSRVTNHYVAGGEAVEQPAKLRPLSPLPRSPLPGTPSCIRRREAGAPVPQRFRRPWIPAHSRDPSDYFAPIFCMKKALCYQCRNFRAKVLRQQCRLSDARQTIGAFVGPCPLPDQVTPPRRLCPNSQSRPAMARARGGGRLRSPAAGALTGSVYFMVREPAPESVPASPSPKRRGRLAFTKRPFDYLDRYSLVCSMLGQGVPYNFSALRRSVLRSSRSSRTRS